VLGGEPREPGHRVEDWTWKAKRVRSTVRGGCDGSVRDGSVALQS
jgi:hypothetical protein